MILKSVLTLAQDLLQLYLYTDWLCHLASCMAINNQTLTKHTQGPGPPLLASSIASVLLSNVTLNVTSVENNETTAYFIDSTNASSNHRVPEDSVMATNIKIAASHLEYGSQTYVIILLSTVVLVAIVFTIFGLFMKAEAHSKSDIRSALLFDDKNSNLLSFSGMGVQGVGLDTTL